MDGMLERPPLTSLDPNKDHVMNVSILVAWGLDCNFRGLAFQLSTKRQKMDEAVRYLRFNILRLGLIYTERSTYARKHFLNEIFMKPLHFYHK